MDPPEIGQISKAYARQCRQTHFFDIDDYFEGSVFPFSRIRGNREAEIMMELANLAIQEYNEKESNDFKYKVLKIEKVNFTVLWDCTRRIG